MIDFLLRLSMIGLFTFISFGIGPAMFPSSSFLAFLIISLLSQIYENDVRQYAWLIIYGIIADVITGVTYGTHAVFYVICTLVLHIVRRKISAHHTTSEKSLMICSVVIVILATLTYEALLHDLSVFFKSWKNLVTVILGSAILYIPLKKILTVLEQTVQDFISARNFKKHR